MSAVRDYEIGERVMAAVNGTGSVRPGVITGKLHTGSATFWNALTMRYFVRFDGDGGASGPCHVVSAEEPKI